MSTNNDRHIQHAWLDKDYGLPGMYIEGPPSYVSSDKQKRIDVSRPKNKPEANANESEK